MKAKILFCIVILFICGLLFGQKPVGQKPEDSPIPGIPAQAIYSNKFRIENLYFNKRVDPQGRGEMLEVEFEIKSQIDKPLDLFIFVIATYEKIEKTKSSLEMPVPEKERIRSFVPYPDDIENYKYPHPSKKGKVMFVKYPKNPKAGVNPNTGKPYHIVDKLMVRTYHLSIYRNNYFYFNEVAIIFFDENGSPLFRQLYEISGVRK